MALDAMRFTSRDTLGLTRHRRFEGVTLGELGEQDPQIGDYLGELCKPGRVSENKAGCWTTGRRLLESASDTWVERWQEALQ